jgi:Fe-S cluster assembly iron-binding protein IscA
MLTLSPSAVEAVDHLLHGESVPEGAGLRIGTTDDAQQLTLALTAAPAPGDEVIEESGARVFVDPQAAPLVDNAQLEAQTQGDQVAFGLAPQGDDMPGGESENGGQP